MYITPYYNKDEDKFYITERYNGQRIINTLKPIYEYYVEDEFGNFEATNGKRVRKIEAKNGIKEFLALKKQYVDAGKRTYEMSFDTSFKVLEKYYAGTPSPKIHKCFLDIECEILDGKPFGGLPKCNERINCITLYCEWLQKSITFCLAPVQKWGGVEPISQEEAKSICDSIDDVILCDTEEQLLTMTAKIIRESDVISGWASEFLDVPYILGRAEKLLGTEFLSKFSPLDKPAEKKVLSEVGDKVTYEWTIPGIVHIDYLKLYKKITT